MSVNRGDRVRIVGAHPWSGYAGTVEHVSPLDGGITVRLDCGLRATAADPKYWERLCEECGGELEDSEESPCRGCCRCGECDTCVQRFIEGQADAEAEAHLKWEPAREANL